MMTFDPEKKLRIIFLGTPEFAVPSLEILVQNGYDVVAVITAPDKPGGRGMQLQHSAVKNFAVDHQLNVLQPTNLKDPVFIEELQSLKPDLQVVVAFRMLPKAVWQLPPIGTFNLHASLLPQYRGAAPINWAIMNGETETGLTTFFLSHEIDTGKIIFQEEITIGAEETAGALHDRMKTAGASLVLKTVSAINSNNYALKEQSENSLLKKAPKIFTEDCRIDWSLPAQTIQNRIRGLSPYPAAFTTLKGKILKIFSSAKIETAHSIPTGELVTDGKSYLRFAVADGFIDVSELQLEGKRKMNVKEFLAGYRAGS